MGRNQLTQIPLLSPMTTHRPDGADTRPLDRRSQAQVVLVHGVYTNYTGDDSVGGFADNGRMTFFHGIRTLGRVCETKRLHMVLALP